MNISIGSIKAICSELGLRYTWETSDEERSFKVASLFKPIPNGFYFFNGSTDFPATVSSSLIVVSSEFNGKVNRDNELIFIEEIEPQLAYYKILNTFFSRQSTGQIASSAVIHPKSEIGKNVQIDDFCIIEENCVIGDNVIIGSHTKIHKGSVICENSILEAMCVIGAQGVAWTWNENQTRKIIQPQVGGVYIGSNCFLGANSILVKGSLNEKTSVGNNSLLAPGCRLGHGTQIGRNVHLANSVVTGGNTSIGDFSFVGSAAVFRPRVLVNEKTVVAAGAVVVKNTSTSGMTLIGVPAKEIKTKQTLSGMPAPKL